MVHRKFLFALLLLATVWPYGVIAQSPPQTQAPTEAPPQLVEDPLGRSNPREAVLNFIRAGQRDDFVRAADYLNSKQTHTHKQELARALYRVMNLSLKVNLDGLNRSAEGSLVDGLPLNRELVGTAKTADYTLDIFLDRVQTGKEQPIWLFAAETLLDLPEFHEKLADPWVERYVPRFFLERTLFGFTLFQLFGLPTAMAIMLGIAWWVGSIVTWVFRRTFFKAIRTRFAHEEVTFRGPLRLAIFTILLAVFAQSGTSLQVRQLWLRTYVVLIAVAVAWALIVLTDVIGAIFAARLVRINEQHRLAAAQLYQWMAKALAVIIGVLIVLRMQGVDLGTTIAGLGIGGVAIAFAAQKTIENLFGTVTLIADEPIRIGDFCRLGDTLGTIEKIGLRSTGIRTLDRTMVSLPNGQLASMKLENFSGRDKFWFNHTIGVRLETSADQLRFVIVGIRSLLQEHPKVELDSARVRLIRLGGPDGSCLSLEIFAYVLAPEWPDFLEIQENLLLRIMDIVEESGTRIVSSALTTYLTEDSGLDPEKSTAAASRVRKWREQNKLPFQRYPSRKAGSTPENSF